MRIGYCYKCRAVNTRAEIDRGAGLCWNCRTDLVPPGALVPIPAKPAAEYRKRGRLAPRIKGSLLDGLSLFSYGCLTVVKWLVDWKARRLARTRQSR
jgi:hypothetical protein